MKNNKCDEQVRSIHILNNNKCRTYALFKSQILKEENYLKYIYNQSKRKLLARFRMGVSTLRIETGRYENNGDKKHRGLPVKWRICKCCILNKVEDEIHFLIECPYYKEIRSIFLNKISIIMEKENIMDKKVLFSLPNDVLFSNLMSCQNKSIVQYLADFIWNAFKLRSQVT